MNTLTKGFAKRVLSALLATIMVFSLGIVGLTSASAANVELAETGGTHGENAYIYFIKPSGWTNVSLLIGHNNYSEMRTFTQLSDNLYYLKMVKWEGWTEWAIVDATGWGSNNEKVSQRIGGAAHKTDINTSYEFYANNTYLVKQTTANTANYTNGYEGLDTVQYAYAQLSTNGGTSGTNNSATGSVNISTKEMTNNGVLSNTSGTNQATAANGVKVNLTATAKAGYKFLGWYNSSGTRVSTSTSYSYICSGSTATHYARFESSFNFAVDASLSSDSVIYTGTDIEILASSNGEAQGSTVTYTLKDSDGNTVGESNTDGVFVIDTTNFAAGTYKYTVHASCTISGANYSDTSSEISVTVNKFDKLTITPVAPSSVEFGDNIDITVTSNTDSEVTYVLKDGEGNVLATNTTGIFSQATNAQDKDTTKTFIVEATTVVGVTTYTSTVSISVYVTAISNTRTINIYFKSTSTKGFAPVATVTGMYETLTDVKMTKSQYIISNETETADYWWYVVSTKVSETNSNLSFNVKSSRYDMEVTAYFEAVDGVDDYYFAIDNLYYTDGSNDIVNVTNWNPVQRNYCENAVHMLYDADYDTEEELEEFASKCVMGLNGDVNNDDAINIKDATYLQKSLVNLAELGSVGEKVSDFDNDGVNTIKDATAIQKAVAGL